MTDTLKVGDEVLTSRTTVKPAHVRKNGETIPEKIKTVLREGKLRCQVRGGWIVEWRDSADRKRTETYFDHEITKVGTNPLLLKPSDK
jgi:hypothetical protein